MGSLQFEKEYNVHVYETGPDGKLNIYSLFNYLQDIASDHAEKLGFGRDDLMRDNHFWVLSRIYAEIKKWPVWEDSIKVKTWPAGTDKLFALRSYEVRFPDGSFIASATSSWLILDRETKKIQRPDSVLAKYNPNLHSGDSPVRHASKLDPVNEDNHISTGYRIKVSDLDINLHTNNVRYLKWIADTYDLDFILKNTPNSVEINYLAESIYDEEVILKKSIEEENGCFYNHSVLRTNDNKELCRIKIGWSENKNQ
jgi:acyl-ACP thioesterase